jgi:hypothetical protein
MFIGVARVRSFRFLEKVTSPCLRGTDLARSFHSFGNHSFALLCAADRKHESASIRRFNFRHTLATLYIGGDEALLKRKNEKTLQIISVQSGKGPPAEKNRLGSSTHDGGIKAHADCSGHG